MQRVNEFSFYELAAKIHPLAEVQGDLKMSGVWFEWWEARAALSTIFMLRPLSVSLSAANKLWRVITEFIPEKWEDVIAALPAADSPADTILAWRTAALRRAAGEFETVLAAECQVLDTYFVSKKGAYSTADLIERAHTVFPEQVLNQLPEQAKNDFDQAGKCIALDVPTAAAFHLLRGTEAVLRKYYEAVVPGPKKAPAKMRNWGVYIRLLSQHGGEQKVISLLTHLKDAYRNPVLHPEENYTDDRAQVLFGVCVSAVVLMINEISELAKQSAALLPFPAPGAESAASD
jgi:hypothetical protein